MIKLYISGAMSKYPDYNFLQFLKKEEELKKLYQSVEIEIINPVKLSLELCKKLNKKLHEINRIEYIENDIKEVKKCNVIYMMKGWEESEGANLELDIAKEYGLYILYEENK